MFSEGEDQPQFEPEWKAVFERDFCKICKNRKCCPYDWICHDMEEFIKNNENYYENLDDDNSDRGDQ